MKYSFKFCETSRNALKINDWMSAKRMPGELVDKGAICEFYAAKAEYVPGADGSIILPRYSC
ncbi:MAG: hypothetical protein CVV42_16155 [Candidatus Riflebacteria bacterium HGW-Riflebacteria-2]|nr:MAG: hypothetical protein CVV42_16155 [Candidatus Riflebacteria bacterium HGW-Riflebacteria-2]